MKGIMKTTLGFICFMSLLLACAEAETFIGQLAWTFSMLTICATSGKILINKYMTKEEQEEEV